MRNMRMNPKTSDKPTSKPGISTPAFSCSSGLGAGSSRCPIVVRTSMSNDGAASLLVCVWRLVCATAALIESVISLLSNPSVHGLLRATIRTRCECVAVADDAAASIPSGIMTINEVPTRIPTPRLVMNRSCDCDSVNESGNAPATKELQLRSVSSRSCLRRWTRTLLPLRPI